MVKIGILSLNVHISKRLLSINSISYFARIFYFSGGYIIFNTRTDMLRHMEFSTFEETVNKLEEDQMWTKIAAETYNKFENTDDKCVVNVYKVTC